MSDAYCQCENGGASFNGYRVDEGGNGMLLCTGCGAAMRESQYTAICGLERDCAEVERLRALAGELAAALEDLHAMVIGECPSLLEDDHHDDIVRAALAKAREAGIGGAK